MVQVAIKGIKRKRAKGKVYHYAWDGGPPIKDASGRHIGPDHPDFLKAYNAIVAAHRMPDTNRFSTLITRYKDSDDYKDMATSTKSKWAPWLDKITDHFGKLHIAQFDRTDKIRPVIRRWRAQWQKQPRTADYGMQVLSRVCSYGVDPLGVLNSNPCSGIKNMYSSDRSDIIWTDADIEKIKAKSSTEIGWAVDLAAHTGLRLGDLMRLSWSHVGENQITIYTSKGDKQKLVAIIPIYADLRNVLSNITKRATTVLTNTRGVPWSVNGFGTSFDNAKIAAGMKPDPKNEQDQTEDNGLHFHDLRGTAATKFYNAGIPIRSIAEIMAWTEDSVERIIRRYVHRGAMTKALIEQIDKAQTSTPGTGL